MAGSEHSTSKTPGLAERPLSGNRNDRNGHILMGWSPLPETASKCQSGDSDITLSERSDRDEHYDSWRRFGKAGLSGSWC